ncbi:MAG: peptide chain release factor 1 [Gemmatimonadaceae bacterium]
MSLRDRIAAALARFQEIEQSLSESSTVRDTARMAELGREHSRLAPFAELTGRLYKMDDELAQTRELVSVDDPEMAAEARAEVERLTSAIVAAELEIKPLLVPPDPLDDRNCIVEIRPGTGGDEAALFAADLLRMYQRFSDTKRWKIEIMSMSEGTLGGIKEAVFKVSGKSAFGTMRWESGAHRVQRVPHTESQGRIHTSAATVAVLPEAEEVDVKIDEKELRVDVFRASGPGGQGVNTTDSAVRITHLPTGLVVSQQDQRSQIQNRAKAMEVLRARLLDLRIAQQQAERARMRKTQVGTGDRSDKIRTYNFPQSRVTDHRIGYTTHDLAGILNGDLDDLTDALRSADVEERLAGGDA